MREILLSPPAAFLIVLVASALLSWLFSRLSLRRKGPVGDLDKAYACGEDVPSHLIQPDYTEFFPFAFFFTILHVVTLMIATVPMETISSFSIAVIYIIGAVTGLVILFRR